MSGGERPKPVPIDQCRDVFDVLDQIRLRPGMWVRQGGLRDLEAMLHGYGVALLVHGVAESSAFSSNGPFTEWLADRRGWSMSCGWAAAIEQNAGDMDPLAVFFDLLDEFRSSRPG